MLLSFSFSMAAVSLSRRMCSSSASANNNSTTSISVAKFTRRLVTCFITVLCKCGRKDDRRLNKTLSSDLFSVAELELDAVVALSVHNWHQDSREKFARVLFGGDRPSGGPSSDFL